MGIVNRCRLSSTTKSSLTDGSKRTLVPYAAHDQFEHNVAIVQKRSVGHEGSLADVRRGMHLGPLCEQMKTQGENSNIGNEIFLAFNL